MPQLDQFTYLTQFVWLCVFYMTFYVLLLNDGLPKISRILKLRAHLSADRNTGSEQHQGALKITSVNSSADIVGFGVESKDVIFRTLSNSISYLNSSVTGAFNWCTKSVDSLNANQLKPMNKSYLRSIGEICLSQLLKSSALEASAPLTVNSRTSMYLDISRVWALRVQKCLLSSINKKKKKK